MKRLVVDYGIIYNRIALLEDNHIVELQIENMYDRSLVGNIYLGKVVNIVKSMSAAFIDIGQKKNAYMPLYKGLVNGSEILVQVRRDAVSDKGATVTTDLSISGQYVVLLPNSSQVMISKKIKKPKIIDALSTLVKSCVGGLGAVIRTEAAIVEEEILKEELLGLMEIWREIASKKNRILKNRLIYEDYGFEALIRKEYLPQVNEMIINDQEAYKKFKSSTCVYYKEPYPIFDHFHIEEQIKKSLQREVILHQGSYITIDETEALTAIDVNSGQFVGSSNKEETFLQVNLAAAKAVSRQIRLRNISGIIIIDFINMKSKDNYDLLLSALKKYFRFDKCSPKIHGVTALGLVEVTRKKNRKSLKTQLLSDCQSCHGSGYEMSEVFFYKQFVEKIKLLRLHTQKTNFDVVCSNQMYKLLNQSIVFGKTYLDVLCEKLEVVINTNVDNELDGYTYKTSGKH